MPTGGHILLKPNDVQLLRRGIRILSYALGAIQILRSQRRGRGGWTTLTTVDYGRGKGVWVWKQNPQVKCFSLKKICFA